VNPGQRSRSPSWDLFHTKQCSACVLPCLYVPVSTNVRLFRVGRVQRNQFKIPTPPVLVLSRYVHSSLAFALIFRHVSQAVGTLVRPSGALAPKFAACCHWEDSSPTCVKLRDFVWLTMCPFMFSLSLSVTWPNVIVSILQFFPAPEVINKCSRAGRSGFVPWQGSSRTLSPTEFDLAYPVQNGVNSVRAWSLPLLSVVEVQNAWSFIFTPSWHGAWCSGTSYRISFSV
jgi:hypothetical protein